MPVSSSRLASLSALVCLLATPVVADRINISQFVFRDTNMNGVYDRGEEPLSGFPVTIHQDGQDPVTETSNLNGFANFVLSIDEEDADLRGSGEIRVEFGAWPGWDITTPNTEFHSEIVELADSPAGLIVDRPFPFLGLALRPAIFSAIPEEEADGSLGCDNGSISVRGTVGADAVGQADMTMFSCYLPMEALQDMWGIPTALNAVSDGPGLALREVVPGYGHTFVAAPVPSVPASVSGEPMRSVIYSFDDLITSNDIREMPSGADGLAWHNWVVTNRRFYGGSGYVNSVTSGEYIAYTSSGHPATIRSDTPFDFVQAMMTVAWPRAGGGYVIVEAFRGDELVGREAIRLRTRGPVRFYADWTGITELRVSHSTYWQVIVDDLELRVAATD
ncbi:MAG: hypothetical protein JJ938_08675 [Roseicyclus sp.]|nr:hypothetical protein [Roseicyclus sp.]MBO6624941.1 hypothetical protein [Roseicyclus sp.]MBO6921231.1 hypothetical protein [Roseicyclus sp.]